MQLHVADFAAIHMARWLASILANLDINTQSASMTLSVALVAVFEVDGHGCYALVIAGCALPPPPASNRVGMSLANHITVGMQAWIEAST